MIQKSIGTTPKIDLRSKILNKIKQGQICIASPFNALIISKSLQLAFFSTLIINAVALYFLILELIEGDTLTYFKQYVLGLNEYRYLAWPALGQAIPWLTLAACLVLTMAAVFILLIRKNLNRNNSLI